MWRELIAGIRSLVGLGGPTGSEARDRARVLCRYQVSCRPVSGGPAFEASVVDISRTGMRMEGVSPLKGGDRLSLAYTPYAGEAAPESAGPVEVEVVWCRKRPHDNKLLAGVRYCGPLESSWVEHVFLEVGLARENQAFKKRQHIRLTTSLKAEIRDNNTGQYLCEGKVANLSMGGVLIQTDVEVSENQPVLVLVSPYGSFPILSLTGTIVNCRTDVEEDRSLVSVQFVNVSASDSRTLKRYIFSLLKGRSIG